MKKILCILLLITLSVSILTAQEGNDTTNKPKFFLGPKIGLTMSSVADGFFGSPPQDSDPLYSFAFGVFGMYFVTDNLFLQGELLYQKKGAKTLSTDIENDMQYITIPVTINYGSSDFSIGLGPELGFFVNSSRSPLKDEAKNIDLGIVIKASAYFDISQKSKLVLDAYLGSSLAKITDSGSMHNFYFLLTAGVAFNLF